MSTSQPPSRDDSRQVSDATRDLAASSRSVAHALSVAAALANAPVAFVATRAGALAAHGADAAQLRPGPILTRLADGAVVSIEDASADASLYADDMANAPLLLRSFASVTCSAQGQPRALLVVAHREPTKHGEATLEALTALGALFAETIASELSLRDARSLVRNVIHDLNNLCMGTGSIVDMLLEEPLDASSGEALREVSKGLGKIAAVSRQLSMWRSSAGPTSVPPSAPLSVAPPALSGMVVLVADDEPAMRTTLARALEQVGARVLLAWEGDAVVALLGDSIEIDVALIDLHLPYRGDDLLATIQTVKRGARVVVMSGHLGSLAPEQCDGRLQKPFSRQMLLAELTRHAGHRR